MAKALYGGVGLQGLSGSINKKAGGHTFSKNNVVRRRVVPVNPQSSSQQELRAAFLFLTSAWSNVLSDANRLAWESARNTSYWLKQDSLTGVSRPYSSAKDLFIATNLNDLIASDSLSMPQVSFSDPGTSSGLDDLSVTSIVLDDSSQSVVFTYSGALLNENICVYMTSPVSAGTLRATSVKSKLRFVTQNIGASPAAISSDYISKFGSFAGATGKKVFWEVYGVDTNTGKKRLIAAGNSIIAA